MCFVIPENIISDIISFPFKFVLQYLYFIDYIVKYSVRVHLAEDARACGYISAIWASAEYFTTDSVTFFYNINILVT